MPTYLSDDEVSSIGFADEPDSGSSFLSDDEVSAIGFADEPDSPIVKPKRTAIATDQPLIPNNLSAGEWLGAMNPFSSLPSDSRSAVFDDPAMTPMEQGVAGWTSAGLAAVPGVRHVARETFGGEASTGNQWVDTARGLGASVAEYGLANAYGGPWAGRATLGLQALSENMLNEQNQAYRQNEDLGFGDKMLRATGFQASNEDDTPLMRLAEGGMIPLSVLAGEAGNRLGDKLAGSAIVPRVLGNLAFDAPDALAESAIDAYGRGEPMSLENLRASGLIGTGASLLSSLMGGRPVKPGAVNAGEADVSGAVRPESEARPDVEMTKNPMDDGSAVKIEPDVPMTRAEVEKLVAERLAGRKPTEPIAQDAQVEAPDYAFPPEPKEPSLVASDYAKRVRQLGEKHADVLIGEGQSERSARDAQERLDFEQIPTAKTAKPALPPSDEAATEIFNFKSKNPSLGLDDERARNIVSIAKNDQPLSSLGGKISAAERKFYSSVKETRFTSEPSKESMLLQISDGVRRGKISPEKLVEMSTDLFGANAYQKREFMDLIQNSSMGHAERTANFERFVKGDMTRVQYEMQRDQLNARFGEPGEPTNAPMRESETGQEPYPQAYAPETKEPIIRQDNRYVSRSPESLFRQEPSPSATVSPTQAVAQRGKPKLEPMDKPAKPSKASKPRPEPKPYVAADDIKEPLRWDTEPEPESVGAVKAAEPTIETKPKPKAEPVEPPTAKAAPETSADEPIPNSLKKSVQKAQLRKIGLPGLDTPEVHKWKTASEEAKESGFVKNAESIARGVTESGEQLGDTKSAGLLIRKAELLDEYESLIKGNQSDPDIRGRISKIKDEFNTIVRAVDQSGTEAARELNMHRAFIDEDMNMLSLGYRHESEVGKPMTDKDRTFYESKIKEHEAVIEKLKKAEDTRTEAQADSILKPRKKPKQKL